MKYYNYQITTSEIPDEITLCINLTNCPIHCADCHSKFLWEDVGVELTKDELYRILDENPGISCVCFMGGDANYKELAHLYGYVCDWIVERGTFIHTAVYSGRKDVQDMIDHGATFWLQALTYLKVGPYIRELGSIDKPSTNQRLYHMGSTHIDKILNLAQYNSGNDKTWFVYGEDITHKFWNKENIGN